RVLGPFCRASTPLASALPPKTDIARRDRHVRFVPKAHIAVPSRANSHPRCVIVGQTNNWAKAACVGRLERLDWFQEQGDRRTLRFAAPPQPPKHLSRGR